MDFISCFGSDFTFRLNTLWADTLSELQEDENVSFEIHSIAGALPKEVLAMYVKNGCSGVSCIVYRFVSLERIALLNSEALRKLIRKFDKQTGQVNRSINMLPALYSSSLALGLPHLLDAIGVLRELIDIEEHRMQSDVSSDTLSSQDATLSRRADEIEWLRDNVKSLSSSDLTAVVAHRGFHNVDDKSDNRPLENTLNSFEQIWTAGLSLCECDVALTRDEKIVMAHDDCFKRLALCESCDISGKRVSELTLSEIFSLNLKSGNRPPLLIDCLRSAAAIGEHSKLIVEIKPGNSEIVAPLVRLFERHLGLLSHVEVIMSFDLFIIDNVSCELAASMPNSLGRRASSMNSMKGFHSEARFASRGSVSFIGGFTTYPKSHKIPHFLLVTRTKSSSKPGSTYCVVSVRDLSPVDGWLDSSNIDGVYLEYEPEMLEPDGQLAMLDLSKKCKVGVWLLANRDPDKLSICRRLVDECGVHYFNTDFPYDFFYT